MKRIRPSAADSPSNDAIVLGADGAGRDGAGARWGVWLSYFMRLTGAVWMARGLGDWREILAPLDAPLDALPMAVASAIVFFAVADLLAAVGLWLATAWGGVLWLFAASAGLISAPFLPNFGWLAKVMMGVDVVFILVYFVLTWRAAQERDD